MIYLFLIKNGNCIAYVKETEETSIMKNGSQVEFSFCKTIDGTLVNRQSAKISRAKKWMVHGWSLADHAVYVNRGFVAYPQFFVYEQE